MTGNEKRLSSGQQTRGGRRSNPCEGRLHLTCYLFNVRRLLSAVWVR